MSVDLGPSWETCAWPDNSWTWTVLTRPRLCVHSRKFCSYVATAWPYVHRFVDRYKRNPSTACGPYLLNGTAIVRGRDSSLDLPAGHYIREHCCYLWSGLSIDRKLFHSLDMRRSWLPRGFHSIVPITSVIACSMIRLGRSFHAHCQTSSLRGKSRRLPDSQRLPRLSSWPMTRF